MIPSLEQYEKWASLGLQVATAVQSGEYQERERHIQVSGQIRGYLRWYADLTRYSGYWPLAESIAYALQDGGFDQSKLQWLTELFAAEENNTPQQVEKIMAAVAWIAVDKRPDFALLVMGGATRVNFLLRFIVSSMRWLKRYQLCMRVHKWNEKEAFWVYVDRQKLNVRRDAAYISTEDYLIVTELSRGQGRRKLAQKLGYTLQDINDRYQQVVERAQLIASKAGSMQIPTGRENWNIADYLNFLGMPPHSEGQVVLEAAIRIAQEQPELLNDMTGEFYPALATELNKTSGKISREVKGAIYRLSEIQSSTEFFQFAGLTSGKPIITKKFFETFIKYMDQ